jgi:hypothetical protein
MQPPFVTEAQLGRLAATALWSSYLLFWALIFLGFSIAGHVTLQIIAAAVLLVVYALLAHSLNTIGRHPPLRRLRTWQVSLSAHALIAVVAIGAFRDIRVLGLLVPEAFSAVLHFFGIHFASKSLRAA